MAISAVAQATVSTLRQKIAKLEGRSAAHLVTPAEAGSERMLLRQNGLPSPLTDHLPTGARGLDMALGGGLPRAALIEIYGIETRDAGAVSGFALAASSLFLKEKQMAKPLLLWIGTAEIFREAGFPYSPGIETVFGIPPGVLLLAEAARPADALWIAGEAASLHVLSAVFLEMRGRPRALDLTATRRLHWKAQHAGRPVFLLRQSSAPAPTAAPVRLLVTPAPAAPRPTISGPLPRSIGPPGFNVRVDRSRTALPAEFTLEWNPDERAFQERRPQDIVTVASPSRHGPDLAPSSRSVLALGSGPQTALGNRLPPGQYETYSGRRRAG